MRVIRDDMEKIQNELRDIQNAYDESKRKQRELELENKLLHQKKSHL